MQNNIICPTCGFTAAQEEFEPHPNGTGVWCCDCQTFIWHDPTNNHQSSTILLETTAPIEEQEPQASVYYKFKKRLSPLRYPGGKSKLIDYLATKLRPNRLDTFVEVFAGGASFGLSLLDAGVINHLVLNDADKNLITFWHEVLHNPEPIINKLQTIHPTHEDYKAAKHLLAEPSPASFTELAWAYLLVNRLSYSGIQKAGCLGGKHGPTEVLLARYNPKTLIDQMNHLAALKSRITLLNQDYSEVIENYYWDDRVTLFIVIFTPYMLGSLGAMLCK